MQFGTKAVHAGVKPDPSTGAIMTPIYQTSTYVQEGIGKHKGYEYSRTHNPTRTALQQALAALENGKYGICFASGLAATDAILKLLQPGDEVIATNDLYGGTYRIFKTVFEKYSIRFTFLPLQNANVLKHALHPKVKMIWIETPTNPTLSIIDIKAIKETLKDKKDTWLVVDNTFASPYLQNPLELGADIVVHSVTKYLGGHSDVVMGAAITNDDFLASELYRLQNSCGAVPGPMDCFLVLRGLKTLHIRMQRHCENAQKIAEFLSSHPLVDKVNYPGLPAHPQYHIARQQMKGFGGMISFTLKNNDLELAKQVVERLSLFSLAESLGGVESLVGHPASMTHASIPKEEREKAGITDSLIRLSVGIEDVDDLIADLKNALTIQINERV